MCLNQAYPIKKVSLNQDLTICSSMLVPDTCDQWFELEIFFEGANLI